MVQLDGFRSMGRSVKQRTLFSQCATTSSSHFWWSVTGSHDSVACRGTPGYQSGKTEKD